MVRPERWRTLPSSWRLDNGRSILSTVRPWLARRVACSRYSVSMIRRYFMLTESREHATRLGGPIAPRAADRPVRLLVHFTSGLRLRVMVTSPPMGLGALMDRTRFSPNWKVTVPLLWKPLKAPVPLTNVTLVTN